jgi:DNA invertase Pin-like site-specific DNA recombinase
VKAYSYIRFSTPEQEKGDSLRRQLKQSEDYAQANGLVLDDALRLTDRGLSAFHGVHRVKGALGEFHHLVEQGEVEPGSVLLVESLDRLSREQVLDALTQFTSLIRAGVKVVTLADRMEYDTESINANFGQLLMSLVIMSRAHEESKIKSFRGRESWDRKRQEAGHKPLTARCPAWLRLKDDQFEVRPEVAEAIRKIFAMKLAGKGSERIAWELNQNGAWKPAKGWRKSYIVKLLHNNRALLGEFQPHKKIEGKRVPEGEPIPGYFPAIIDPELFNQVQAVIQENKVMQGNAGGRNGPVNNLFSLLAKCAYCGGPMAYVDKGTPPKGGSYLVCDTARRGVGCQKLFLRYDKFEPLILSYCKGLEPSELLPDGGKSELAGLRNQLQGVEGELGQLEGKIVKLMDSLEDADSPEFLKLVKDRVQAHQTRKVKLDKQAEGLRKKIAKASSVEADTEKQLQSVKELIDRMGELTGQERIDLRLNLRNQLRRLIEQLNFFPDLGQVGMIFITGERRLLIVEGDEVRLLDILSRADRVPSQLWKKPWA